MKQRTSIYASTSLVLTSLFAAACFPRMSPGAVATGTAVVAPVFLPTPSLVAPPSLETAQEAFVLPSPVFASFETDDFTVELREYALNLTTPELQDPEALAPVYAVLEKNRWQPARTSTAYGATDEETKRLLNAWGFHCENNGLYKDGQLLVQSVACNEGDATVNRSQSDFVWFLPVGNREVGWMVRRDSLDQAWHQRDHFWVMPKFVGDDLLIVRGFPGEKGPEIRVERNGQAVFNQTLPGTGDCLGTGLQVWEDEHWGLNTEVEVIIDGERVGQTQRYTEAFGLRVLQGKPVYFVAQEQEIKVVLAGQVIPLEYDQIMHPCYPVYQEVFYRLDIGVRPEMLWFFAREGGAWYYVEMEIHSHGH